MLDWLNVIPVSVDVWTYLGLDLVLALALLSVLKWFSGKLSSVDSNEELCTRDNFAFGLSLAGRMLALSIVLSGAIASSQAQSVREAVLEMLLYGALGLILVKVGRVAHDKLILDELDKDQLIRERNISVALVDASSAVATALIIRSVILWVEGANLNAIIAVVSGFLVTQAILLATTRLYEYRFARNNQGTSLQKSLTHGQLALAIKHSGHLLGTALTVTVANNLLVYEPLGYITNLLGWLTVGLVLTLFLQLLLTVAKRVILSGINLAQEVDLRHNVGVAAIEMSLSVGIALIISGLLAG